MARQLVFTSVPQGLTPGRTGYCTVARHRDLRDRLVPLLESLSIYPSEWQPAPVICTYRLVELAGLTFPVLTRIVAAGQDYSHRAVFLAHHLVLDPGEINDAPPPAEVFMRWPGWRNRWDEPPKWLDESDRVDLRKLPPAPEPALPAQTWETLTNDAGKAALLLDGTKPRFWRLGSDPACEEYLLALFRESSALLEPAQAWQAEFTTGLQPTESAKSYKWAALRLGSPVDTASARVGDFLDLTRPESLPPAPSNDATERARRGNIPPKPAPVVVPVPPLVSTPVAVPLPPIVAVPVAIRPPAPAIPPPIPPVIPAPVAPIAEVKKIIPAPDRASPSPIIVPAGPVEKIIAPPERASRSPFIAPSAPVEKIISPPAPIQKIAPAPMENEKPRGVSSDVSPPIAEPPSPNKKRLLAALAAFLLMGLIAFAFFARRSHSSSSTSPQASIQSSQTAPKTLVASNASNTQKTPAPAQSSAQPAQTTSKTVSKIAAPTLQNTPTPPKSSGRPNYAPPKALAVPNAPDPKKNLFLAFPSQLALELVWIGPGTFTMGSPASEAGRNKDEGPQTKVTLTQGFWLGKYDVTQAEWTAIMDSNPSDTKNIGDSNPVDTVSWDFAMAFCHLLTEQERAAGRLPAGYEYTLPTEAQWECACRAGSTEAVADNLDDVAWYNANSDGNSHPVGQKQPNAWGLYDMQGNTMQWVRDWDGTYPGGSVSDPVGPATAAKHLARGSNYASRPTDIRNAKRLWHPINYQNNGLGLRIALAPVIAPVKSSASTPVAPPAATSPQPAVAVRPARTAPKTVAKTDGPDPQKNLSLAFPDQPALEMVWIVPGTFTMGSPNAEAGRYSDEGSQTEVTLTQGFWLGQYDVTQEEWTTIMDGNPSGGNNLGPTNPVDNISWDSAMAFCQALTDEERTAGRLPTGYEYTLPTEAQWEYACRAGNAQSADNFDDIAWYDANAGKTTHPVGQKKPNAWGLYDMHGDVMQWVRDWYGHYPGGSITDPVGPTTGTRRIARGGYYGSPPADLRDARRGQYLQSDINGLGFRLALAPVSTPTAK